MREGQLEPGAVDLGLIPQHQRLVLLHQRGLAVELLLRNRVVRDQTAIALQVDHGIGELRAVLLQSGQGVVQRDLERPRVDHRQQIACMNDLTLAEGDLDQLAVDPRVERDRIARDHRAQRAEHHLERRLDRCRLGRHRGRPIGGVRPALAFAGSGCGGCVGLGQAPGRRAQQHQQRNGRHGPPAPEPARVGGLGLRGRIALLADIPEGHPRVPQEWIMCPAVRSNTPLDPRRDR